MKKKNTCKEYYEYIIKTLERVQSNNVSISGKMEEKCFDYFKKQGIEIRKEPFGYLHFKKKND